jgi:hypothetical protein
MRWIVRTVSCIYDAAAAATADCHIADIITIVIVNTAYCVATTIVHIITNIIIIIIIVIVLTIIIITTTTAIVILTVAADATHTINIEQPSVQHSTDRLQNHFPYVTRKYARTLKI